MPCAYYKQVDLTVEGNLVFFVCFSFFSFLSFFSVFGYFGYFGYFIFLSRQEA